MPVGWSPSPTIPCHTVLLVEASEWTKPLAWTDLQMFLVGKTLADEPLPLGCVVADHAVDHLRLSDERRVHVMTVLKQVPCQLNDYRVTVPK